MHKITPIPALNDNYIWMIVHPHQQQAVIVDPGEAAPALEALRREKLELTAILITHRHWDHVNGVNELLEHYNVPVYGPSKEADEVVGHPLADGQQLTLPDMDINFTILDIPGHTLGHIAYVSDDLVFSGDTLFTAGCGRIFEGTAEQMYDSLQKMAKLPENTLVYCGHEYTESNLKFAQVVEPNNSDVAQRIIETKKLREANTPSVPASIALELRTNPFLRCQEAAVSEAVSNHFKQKISKPIEVLAALREWKNDF